MKKLLTLAFISFVCLIQLKAQVQNSCLPDTMNKIIITPLDAINQELPPLGPPTTPPISPVRDTSEFRMVFWVHGMNGDASSWSKAATASSVPIVSGPIPGFPPRKIFSRLVDYSNVQVDLSSAALDLDGDLINNPDLPANYDKKNSFIIGHSQGGLVTRALNYQKISQGLPLKYGGFVTFGTPHRGIVGLTGNNKTLSYKFFEYAALSLAAGPAQVLQSIVEDLKSNFFVKLFKIIPDININDNINDLIRKSLFYNPVTDQNGFILDQIRKEVESGIAKEMAVGSSSLNLLNGFDPKIPSAAFYAVKKPFIHHYMDGRQDLLVKPFWALMHYAINNPNENDFFKANDDWMMAEKARDVYLDYYERAMQYQEVIDVIDNSKCIPGILFPGICVCDHDTYIALRNLPISKNWSTTKQAHVCRVIKRKKEMAKLSLLRDKFLVGSNWVTAANDLWETAIGGQSYIYTGYCYRKILVDDTIVEQRYLPINGICGQSDAPPVPEGGKALGDWKKEKAGILYKEHDGAVLAESARDLPFITDDMKDSFNNDLARMEGSGHMQMRNDKNTKNALNYIFNGEVGDFFRTEKQN
ncbi:MAG: hypothetical protein J5I59_01115 [Saprospiraceae bacterium]|nr:hypothetical protein [Saprospiraceae bacterium]